MISIRKLWDFGVQKKERNIGEKEKWKKKR